MMKPYRKANLRLNYGHEKNIADGAIARDNVGEGRIFPVVILDTSVRPDIDAAIAAHDLGASGDVSLQWRQLPGRKDTVLLTLSFIRPAEAVVMASSISTRATQSWSMQPWQIMGSMFRQGGLETA